MGRKKLSQRNGPGLEIVIDDDSISSTRTSSTVGYRDSFGDNDDGCFHLLERYDDSNAVMRLLQSRRRNSKDKEGTTANKEVGSRKDSLLLAEAGRDALLLEEKETASSEHDEDTETELSNYVIYEHQDENTLI